jgi:hypothetical protein
MINNVRTKVAGRKPLAKVDALLKRENAKTKNATGRTSICYRVEAKMFWSRWLKQTGRL